MSNEQITQETVPVDQATTETTQPTATPTTVAKTDTPTSSWKDSISEDNLAMVAGLSNPNSVKNAIKNGEMEAFPGLPLKTIETSSSRFFEGQPTKNSALNWALDKKRKYEVHEPIDKKPERNIDYSYLLKEIIYWIVLLQQYRWIMT